MTVYNLEKTFSGRWKGYFSLFLMSLLGATAIPSAKAQANQAAGIVIYKAVKSDGPQFYNGFVFKSIRDTGAWLAFDVGQLKPTEIEKGLIVKVLDFEIVGAGNVLTMNILNDQDAQQVAIFRDYIKSETAKMPKLEKLATATIGILDNQISSFNSGNIRMGGSWIDKATWLREQEAKTKATLIIAGKSYSNPRYVSSKEDTITLTHDGGIARLQLSKLSAKDRLQLVSAFKLDPDAIVSTGPNTLDSSPAVTQNANMPSSSRVSPSTEAYLTEKMSKIIFPTFQFQGATIDEAIEYLRVKSRDFDTFPDASGVKGVNVILRQGDTPSNASISLDLKNVPMLEALRYITELAQMKFRVEAQAVLVLPLSEEGLTAMTGTPASSNSTQPIASASNRSARQTGPRIPLLPATMAVEAVGSGISEPEALFDAQFNAVAAALKDHVSSGAGDWSSNVTIENIGDESARTTDDYRKIAMKSGAGSVRVVIETNITREKLVPILLKLGFVE